MNTPFHGIVELNYDAGQELRNGLRDYRNRFCDVRLWVENHAIPAHKLVLSLHSTFFQQMFQSESDPKVSEVYLNDVRYNVLYPIIEFMYTGRANIDSSEAFDEIKLFSRSINFHPFAKLWDTNTQPINPTEPVFVQAPDIHSTVSACTTTVQPISPNKCECNNLASTQVTNCLPTPQTNVNFVPTSSSTPVLNNGIPLTQPSKSSTVAIPTSCVDMPRWVWRKEDSRYVPATPSLHANLSSTLATHSDIIPPTPTSVSQTASIFDFPSTPMDEDFHGFSSKDVTDGLSFPQNSYKNKTSKTIHFNDTINNHKSQANNPTTVNHSFVEESEISQESQIDRSNCNNTNAIGMDETDVEIIENVPQIEIVIPSDDEIPIRKTRKTNKTKTETVAKPKGRRGRPKKDQNSTVDKMFVSTGSLFKKTSQSQRGRKRKNDLN